MTHGIMNNDLNKSHLMLVRLCHLTVSTTKIKKININQRTNGPVKARLISWHSNAQNIQNLVNIR